MFRTLLDPRSLAVESEPPAAVDLLRVLMTGNKYIKQEDKELLPWGPLAPQDRLAGSGRRQSLPAPAARSPAISMRGCPPQHGF